MAKPKTLNYELIKYENANGQTSLPYQIMEQMQQANHPDLIGARIAMAWKSNTKEDKDGHLLLGKLKKVSDLQKEFVPYDFIILLNREVWEDAEFTLDKKTALIDHELCHADLSTDKDGEPRVDERSRPVFRTKKHDIEEFHAIVERHGLYKRDLERFAETLLKRKKVTSE